MNKMVSFFEIPATNFERAVEFYQSVFKVKIEVSDCGETEKMGFFPENQGAISCSEHLKPADGGVLISLQTDDIEKTLAAIDRAGGKTLIGKTAIQPEGKGSFAVFADCEGNKIGLYQSK